jgi:uncharacterized protein
VTDSSTDTGADAGAARASDVTSAGDVFLAQLRSLEGAAVGPPTTGPDPVNQPMIRHWVEAMGDANPVYVDEAVARAEGFSGVVAPATMLQAWIMRGYRATMELQAQRVATSPSSAPPSSAPPSRLSAPSPSEPSSSAASPTLSTGGEPSSSPSAQDALFSLLDGAGFTSVVATDCEQEYVRPLVLGDRLTVASVIESVSAQKRTALGEGHFVTTRSDFTDQHGEHVASMRFRILRFRPRGTSEAAGPHKATPGPDVVAATPGDPSRSARPRPALTEDTAFFFEGARRRQLLVQRCTACRSLRHPPRPVCPSCLSFEWDTLVASGRGRLYSFVVVHHPQVGAFDYPLPIAVVELEEGTRLVADIVDASPGSLRIGMPVEVTFVDVDDDLTLPMFRPAPTPHEVVR